LIKKKMSGIRKCLWEKEKNFLFFLRCAGFFLRFFAYSDKRGRNKQVVKGTLRAEKTCALEELSPACAGAGSALFCLCGQKR
jgi:hypothetical protein